MPITKSASKKMRVDKKRTGVNAPVAAIARSAVKRAKIKLNPEAFSAMYSALDRAVAKKLIPKNRAARLKSRIVKRGKK